MAEMLSCPKCNRKLVPTVESCSGCGVALDKDANGQFVEAESERLTPCPDCGRPLSPYAESCPQCGRVMQRANPPAPTASKKKSSGCGVMMMIVIGIVVLYIIVANMDIERRRKQEATVVGETSSGATVSSADDPAAKRRKFALGFQASTHEGGILRNIGVSTRGPGDVELVLTADNMTEDDCRMIGNSSYAGAMELVGFDLFVCRNRATGTEWEKRLLTQVGAG